MDNWVIYVLLYLIIYVIYTQYYKIAAEKGEGIALSNLGLCYRYGRGVCKNVSYALELFKKAIDAGFEKAKDYYEKAKNEL